MKHILFFIIISILISGCGSGTSDTQSPGEEDKTDVNMTTGFLYTVFPENKIVKYSQDALIKISHQDNARESTVVLLSGKATILR